MLRKQDSGCEPGAPEERATVSAPHIRTISRHALALVRGTEPSLQTPRFAVARLREAPGLMTAIASKQHYPFLLVCGTIQQLPRFLAAIVIPFLAARMLAVPGFSSNVHYPHAGNFVRGTESSPRCTLLTISGRHPTAGMLAALAQEIHHAFLLVLAAEPLFPCLQSAKAGLGEAPRHLAQDRHD